MSIKFEPLKREPAYVKVYNAVEAEILSGELAQGAALPTEAELCAQLGVTRATVREGLRLLEQADLVVRGAAKRFYVKRPDANDVATTTSKSLALGGVTFREVWEALSLMYPQATRLASRRLKKADIARLIDTQQRLEECSEEAAEEIVALAVEFFQCLAGGLGNRVLLAMLQSLNMLIGASLAQVIGQTPNARKRIVQAQKQIISALEQKNDDEAARWIAKHIDDLKRGYSIAKVDLNANVL